MIKLTIALLFIGLTLYAQEKVLLPNGWSLSPAGQTINLGSDLPLNMALSPDGKYLAITNNGVSTQTIQLLETKTWSVLQTKTIPESWLGIKFSSDSKHLFVSGGNHNQILAYTLMNDSLALTDSFVLGDKWPVKISPAGIDIDNIAHKLYVVTKENNSLFVINMVNHAIIKTIPLAAECYECILSPDSKKLYISLWGGGKVMVYNTKLAKITDSINVGKNPNDLCLSRNGKYLFVANSIDNSVSVIETSKNKVIETLNAALFPNAPQGSTTNSVSLSADDHDLFIANADNNCLSVFDVSQPGKSKSEGFIPVGWYPTSVKVSGKNILVLNGKGNRSFANPGGPQPEHREEKENYKKANKNSDQYIGSLMKGTLSVIPYPTPQLLKAYTKQVYINTPYAKNKELTTDGEPGNPVPANVGSPSPIKHLFYIIKENRTYDQVLGDEPMGNGDTSLVLFGKKITPNLHSIAEQFVLLDNFYVDAEVSADGHNWSTAAYANDFVEKTWPTNYGGRGGNYDYVANKEVAKPREGFIWDEALKRGITVRDYGEFTDDDGNEYLPDLEKHMCKEYPGWNLGIKDVDREKIWEHDFDSLVSKNAVASLNILYFPNDHTAGLKQKSRTPIAYVADNDYAVGCFLAHLSQSPVWKDCAVFVLEDDAQNGPDHVDAHRSTAYLAGPFVKRKYVDHTMYTTTGMLRTMELIMGVKPMSQYDAAAMPMYRCFTNNIDITPFVLSEENVDLNEKNRATGILYNTNYHYDLSAADKVPEVKMNNDIWLSIKGFDESPPCPKRSAFVFPNKPGDDNP